MYDPLHYIVSRLKNANRILRFIGIIFVAFFIIHQVVMISDGLNDEESKAEVAVIFGNTVHEDGSLSPRLKARLDKGIELYQQSSISTFFVSGGLGKEGHYEGTKMAEYLVLNGIPASKIVVDNAGNNTRATAVNFKKSFPQVDDAVVVTQYHHVLRAKLAFHQIGLENVSGAHAEFWELRDVYSCIREFFGYYAYLIKY